MNIQPGMKLTAARLNPAPPGIAYSNTSQSPVGTSEVASLIVSNMVFKAGKAYRAYFKTSVYAADGTMANFRLRKTNASGADWGEFGRIRCVANALGSAMMANGGPLILTRSASTDLTADVVLTVSSSSGTNLVTCWGSATTPRYLIIDEVGSAADYLGLGVDVT
ncbi:hypothetical protein [Micromonospora sp. WMMD1274]|uniref:hypothetical protein n=1 Tax=Micromonospora sp. WMMD1274 TaxID=3404116 RepID=UPI003B929C34